MSPEARQALVAWQLQVERRDGPRYVEAIRGAKRWRDWRYPNGHWGRAASCERANGIPEGWAAR